MFCLALGEARLPAQWRGGSWEGLSFSLKGKFLILVMARGIYVGARVRAFITIGVRVCVCVCECVRACVCVRACQ